MTGVDLQTENVAHLIQLALGPVFLISGVGITLSMLTAAAGAHRRPRAHARRPARSATDESKLAHIDKDLQGTSCAARATSTAPSRCRTIVGVPDRAGGHAAVRQRVHAARRAAASSPSCSSLSMVCLSMAFLMFLIEVRIATKSLRIGGTDPALTCNAASPSPSALLAGAAFAADPAERAKAARPRRRSWNPRSPPTGAGPIPTNTLYLELPAGRVIIELAPRFAPQHVANIKAAGRARNSSTASPVGRVQDNFVAQWGDTDETRPTEAAMRKLPDETVIAWNKALPFVKLPDADGYAPRDRLDRRLPRRRRAQARRAGLDGALLRHASAWAATTGPTPAAARSSTWSSARRRASSTATSSLVGRVLRGMELLSSLPRGSGRAGLLREAGAAHARSSACASPPKCPKPSAPPSKCCAPTRRCSRSTSRRAATAATTGSCTPAGHIDVCNITIPVRDIAKP